VNVILVRVAAIGFAFALIASGCRRASESLDDVITRNTAATGGKSAIESIQSIQFRLHITDPGFEVDGIYRATRPGRMRIDVTAEGKHVFTEAFNGRRGWQWKGEGDIVDESPQATAALRHGVELPGKLFGLHELRTRGYELALLPPETIGGASYRVIQVKMSDGYNTSLYIDPISWLITRKRDFRPLHVNIDPRPTTIETAFSDFREIAGVRFAFASADTDLQTGKVLEKTQVNEVIVNPQIDPAIFDRL